jgi:hypothetical protein
MARTVEAHRRQQERKRLRMKDKNEAPQWQVWRTCDLCGKPYCANNYADKKVRVKRWKDIEICAYCYIHVIKNLKPLFERGIIKLAKKYR